ncbi:MAG: NADP-dependent oxidoreductase, partial [Steroidobacteraceae bacterium]
MTRLVNRQQHLVSRPKGEPTLGNFQLVEVPVPGIAAGQVLIRHRYLSLDPYMRGRMREGKSYASPQPLNAVMIGGTAGEVIASRSDRFAVGDQVVSAGGWQQYQVIDVDGPHDLRKVDTSRIPLSAHLGVVGMPGVTAWYGLGQI